MTQTPSSEPESSQTLTDDELIERYGDAVPSTQPEAPPGVTDQELTLLEEGLKDERDWKTLGNVKVGDWLWLENDAGQLTARCVIRHRFDAPKDDETERRVTLWFSDSYLGIAGDEGMTANLATPEEIEAAP